MNLTVLSALEYVLVHYCFCHRLLFNIIYYGIAMMNTTIYLVIVSENKYEAGERVCTAEFYQK